MARENCKGSLFNGHYKWRDKDPTVKAKQTEKIIGIKYVLYLWFIWTFLIRLRNVHIYWRSSILKQEFEHPILQNNVT